jgi:putative colanic acid biosynthesis acetyltransferase WcaF
MKPRNYESRPTAMRDLSAFTTTGYSRGRSLPWQVLWVVTSRVAFSAWWLPARLRPAILRFFGADIGEGVLIRERVRVHWPWKLSIGDHSWIGEGAWLLNLDPISIGSNVCISQEALLCTGSHDRHDPAFGYDNGPIVVEDGAWVAARAIVLRGVVVGAEAVVPAGATVSTSVPSNAMAGSLR